MSRCKSAVIALIVLAGAVLIAVNIDYTDTYVADRFNNALTCGRYETGCTYSLDSFLEFYDFDEVHVVLPNAHHEFKTRFGLPYHHSVVSDTQWSLVLVKDEVVVAEIPIERCFLDHPQDPVCRCFERWAAIIRIVDDGGGPRMEFVGE